jgi:hypothetical protein
MTDALEHHESPTAGGIPMIDDRSTTLDSPTAGQDAGATGGETTHPLAETGREAGQRAGQLFERGTEIGLKQADRGLDVAASGAATVANSIRRVSADIETDQPQLADFASAAADQAEALATYLRDTDMRQMIGNVEDFARRQPLLFVGGAFLLGMATSRFIKAAGGDEGRGQAQRSGNSSGNGYGSASYSTGTSRSKGSDDWSASGAGSRKEF